MYTRIVLTNSCEFASKMAFWIFSIMGNVVGNLFFPFISMQFQPFPFGTCPIWRRTWFTKKNTNVVFAFDAVVARARMNENRNVWIIWAETWSLKCKVRNCFPSTTCRDIFIRMESFAKYSSPWPEIIVSFKNLVKWTLVHLKKICETVNQRPQFSQSKTDRSWINTFFFPWDIRFFCDHDCWLNHPNGQRQKKQQRRRGQNRRDCRVYLDLVDSRDEQQ